MALQKLMLDSSFIILLAAYSRGAKNYIPNQTILFPQCFTSKRFQYTSSVTVPGIKGDPSATEAAGVGEPWLLWRLLNEGRNPLCISQVQAHLFQLLILVLLITVRASGEWRAGGYGRKQAIRQHYGPSRFPQALCREKSPARYYISQEWMKKTIHSQ